MGAFNTIQLRPHLLQYLINEWWYVLLCVASAVVLLIRHRRHAGEKPYPLTGQV